MTVSGTTYKNSFTLDEATTTFSYTFKIIESANMLVQLYDSTEDELSTISADDYTVVGAGNDSGTRTVSWANAANYDSTYTLILSSNLENTQPTDYVEGDDFAQATHELALDRLSIQIRQLKEQVDRALKVAKNMTNPSDLTNLDAGYLYTDGTNWSLGDITTTTTEYNGTLTSGNDASKSATPSAKDIYIATDTFIIYVCHDGTNWTPHYDIRIPSGGTMTITNSSGTTIMTIDESGNIKTAGTVESGGTF